jgi:hypothetical protein
MDARKVSAQFAAYTWFEEVNAGKLTSEDAARFARENWTSFLGCAHEGLGRLLGRMAKGSKSRSRRCREGAAAG